MSCSTGTSRSAKSCWRSTLRLQSPWHVQNFDGGVIMLTVERTIELKAHAGEVLGSSDWITVGQEAIDTFARVTGDDHWIHVDRERASREMPGGRTIAHGLYLLSLIPFLQRSIYAVRRRGRGLNYGYDRIR